MKTFKSYITEVAWSGSLSTMLFDLPRAGISDVMIPISPSIFKRIFPKSVRSTVFHVTDIDGISKLKKIQGKKRSISAFYNMATEMIDYGIQTDGGYVVELEGDVLIAAQDDLASAPDKSGRRWITFSTLMNNPDEYAAGMGGKTKLKGMQNDIEEMMIDIIMDYADDPEFMPDVNKSWIHLRRELEGEGKMLSQVIRDYIDGMENIMKKYSKKLAPLFRNYLKKRTLRVDLDIGDMPDPRDTPQWDELVVNNIKIKMIHVGEVYSEDWEDDEDIHGFQFKTYKRSSDITKYIKNAVKRGK